MEDKVKIRGKYLKTRKQLSQDVRHAKSQLIASSLVKHPAFQAAGNILLYYSVNSEVETTELIEKYIEQKNLFLPVIKGKSRFQAVPIKRPLKLRTGFEGVPEPYTVDPNSVYDDQIELIIVPGVAFGKDGSRLGMGKGYYDRYLKANKRALKIGLAYEEQVLDRVPKEPYDELIDLLITDKQIITCN